MRFIAFILNLLCLYCFLPVNAQSNSDSLKALLNKAKNNERFQLLDQFAIEGGSASETMSWGKQLSDEAVAQNDTYWHAMGLHHQARALSSKGDLKGSQRMRRKVINQFKSIDRKDKVARQMLNYGNVSANLAEYDSAMYYFKQALDLAIEAKDTLTISGAYLNISTIHHELGESEQELEHLLIALDLSKRLKDSTQIGTIQYNLAVFYLNRGQIDKCNEILQELMTLYTSKNHLWGQANIYNIYAQQQFEKQNVDSSLYFLDKAIALYEKMGEKSMVAFITMNQGSTLGMAGRWDESVRKLQQAYDIFVELGELRYASICLHGLSASEEEKGNHTEALELMERAIDISKKIRSTTNTVLWIKELAGLYVKANDYKHAYDLMLEHATLKDTLAEMNNQQAIQEMEAKYQNEKKQLEIQTLEQERALQDAEIDSERTKRFMMLGGLIIALLMFSIAGYAFVQKQKDNKVIQQQKREVEKQRDELHHQKLIVDEKNREILDSINYAKRIQTAILPPDRIVKEYLPNIFILYKPKDVVAGDFYWMESVDDTVYFAAADCTGHGVPGAMVSVICNNGLNRSVREFGLCDPGEILDKTRELVIQEFEKSEEEVKDGMDISLCALGPIVSSSSGAYRELRWAGANNPLWVVRKGAEEIEEIKPDKQPIGKYHRETSFTSHKIKLNKGDTIYIFSDGYPDQFGGNNGKKYKSGNFKRRLLELAQQPIEKQKDILDQEFERWRGELEQIDDVCVIGVCV
ncbi:MAG: tetratricopeptide repeat protein [Salibacteraceae bacterium]